MPSKGHITTEKRKPVCPTLSRLWGIQPGQRVVYYVGDLAKDLEASVRPKGEQGQRLDPPLLYAALLQQIKDTAEELWKAGRVRLVHADLQRPAPPIKGRLTGHCQLTQYIAEGV